MFSNNTERVKHSWKANHDMVPELVSDQLTLKQLIIQRSIQFDLKGDIEIDHGYAFSYQISVFFPSYFQKQVVKSQFSVFDWFAHENDPNSSQKRTLAMMNRIDTNIFRDISVSKDQVP